MKQDLSIIVVGLALLALVWIGWTHVETLRGNNTNSEPVFCTADAKLCSDGSYVGRIAPDCRFAPCPGN